ncbi:MAG: SDR family NAD(P)-dependent oxidoreductase [Anaerovoracaceae bacterium]
MSLNEMFSLKGKTAIVIGGSKGIGKGMAEGLASAGATVVICSRNQKDLDAAANDIMQKTGGEAVGIATDITSVAACEGLVAKVADMFGHIDILINAAGVNARKSVLDFTEEDWDKVQNVQLKYVFFMCQAVARHMVANNIKGRIINTASISSVIGLKNMISYCAAKGGIVQMTKGMAVELAEYGINVNCMAPGYTSTEMTAPLFNDPVKRAEMMTRIPQKRFGLPEDYAAIAVYLASPGADYITGQLITVDGGWLAG